jgi:hypothetical protein
MKYLISINQLMDFEKASDSKKLRIIRDQKSPKVIRVGWYQTPRASIKKSLISNVDETPILEGIEKLKNKILSKPQQITNKMVSLEALEHFMNIKMPQILKNHEFEVIKEKKFKSTIINDVEVLVSPDIIYKIKMDDQIYLGAVKLHISKNNVFTYSQTSKVAAILNQYCEELAIRHSAHVMPQLCLCIDVFGERIVSSPKNQSQALREVQIICDEVKRFWPAA